MSDYRSNVDLPRVASMLRAPPHVLVTTHAKPDGDAFGSVIALTAGLRGLGVKADALLMPPVPAQFKTLRGHEIPHRHTSDFRVPDGALVVILDTGAWSQISPLREALTPHLDRTLIIDHHLAGDVPAATKYIDQTAAATCEIVAQLLDELHSAATSEQPKGDARSAAQGEALRHPFENRTVADAVFAGVASDTGWFRFSNTRPFTHELAARLLRAGVDHAGLYQLLEQADRPEKLALLGRALASLRFLADGAAVVMTLRAEDFAATGATLEETERFVDIPQLVGSVRVVALLVEPPGAPGAPSDRLMTRVSLRSKPGENAVDVNALAKGFGGGGHARAAGAKVDAAIHDVAARVEEAIVAALKT